MGSLVARPYEALVTWSCFASLLLCTVEAMHHPPCPPLPCLLEQLPNLSSLLMSGNDEENCTRMSGM
jgi:hypothetical protein